MGDSARAFLQLKKAEGKNPENPLVHKELMAIYKEMGKEEEARTHFQLYMKYIKK
jgi:Flp pilus assembly protein TadD